MISQKPERQEELMHSQFSRFALAIASILSFMLTACSTHRELVGQAVGFNLTVERAQNEMLLLNVIRAKDRLPMYVTGISGLSGNIQTTLTAGLGGTYTNAKQKGTSGGTSTNLKSLTNAYTPTFGATVSENPTFSLSVLDTQEFIRGFLSPLGKDTLSYFWNQGWPPELLLYLLVQRVEIQKKGEPLKVIRNYPDSQDPDLLAMQSFAVWIRWKFLRRKPQVEQQPVLEDIGPPLPVEEVSNLKHLITMAKEGLILQKVPSSNLFQLQRRQVDFRFKLEPPPGTNTGNGISIAPSAAKLSNQYDQEMIEESEKVAITGADSKTVTFVLRSPEGVLYYLGELVRTANRQDSPKVPYICIQGQYQPLFVAQPSDECPDSLVEVDSGGSKFSIPAVSLHPTKNQELSCTGFEGSLRLKEPDCESGRSMQALSLLTQIMSLQKSAKDIPSTALVRVIGD
jgi:hypothetical protein